MKFLILNADDFGYCHEQTEAIKELWDDRLITSVSFLSVAAGADEALKAAKERSMNVGVHLALNCDGKRDLWFPKSRAESFSGKTGLYDSELRVALRAKRSEVRRELELQYLYLASNGVNVDHADNHCATLYGVNGRRFYLDAFDFCKDHNLPFRFPKTASFVERQLGFQVPSLAKKYLGMMVREAEKRRVLMPDDIISNPWSVERIGRYENLRDYYLGFLDSLPDGITEMFLHPAYYSDDKGLQWQKRVWEFRLLKSGCIVEKAKQKGIELISYGELKQYQNRI